MVSSSCSFHVGAVAPSPWLAMGQRLRNRRVQLGFRKSALVAHLGVSTAFYEDMEGGSVEISPALLGRLSELLKVPVLYFFQDMHPSGQPAQPGPTEASPASGEAPLEALVSAYRALDPVKQRYLLQLARALVQEEGRQQAGAV